MTHRTFAARLDSMPGSRTDRLFMAVFVAIGSVYLIQTATSLRLDTDSVHYFLSAISIADRTPTLAAAYPLGYPTILAWLDMIGLGSPKWIVALNCMFLGLGMAAVWWMAQDRPRIVKQVTLLMTLLSFPVIRTVAMPQPEAAYFGLSLLAIAAMSRITASFSRTNFLLLLFAAVLTAAALTLKIVALALIPALVAAAIMLAGTLRGRTYARGAMLTLFGVGLAAALLGTVVAWENGTISRYITESLAEMSGNPVRHVWQRLEMTLRGVGELAVNLPITKFRWLWPVLPFVGLPVAGFLIWSWRRMQWKAPVLTYVFVYAAVLAVWPYYAPRLWMPIVPLIVLHAVTAVYSFKEKRLVRILARAYLVWFAIAGAVALAFTTRVSLSGGNFLAVYGSNGGFAARTHTDSLHDARVRMIVRRFDAGNPVWRALPETP